MWIDNTFEADVPVGDYVSIDERLFILPEARTTEPPHDLARPLRLMHFDGLHEVHGMTLEELALTINSYPATVSVLEGLVEQHGCGFVVSAAWDRAPDRAQGTQGNLQELLRKPVTDLPLSIRARNCFERHRINVLGDLVRQTESELLRVKGLGRRTLREIRAALWDLGLDIGAAGLPSAHVELSEPAGPGSWPISSSSRDRLIASGIDSVPRLSEQNERSLLDAGVASLDELLVLADALWHMTGAGFAPMSKRTARLQLNLHSLCPVTAVGWPHEIARNLRQIGADTLLDAAHKTATDLAAAGFEAGDLARVERELWRRGLGLACKTDPRLECHSVEMARMFAVELSVSPPEPDRVIEFIEDELSQCLRRLDQERNARIAEQCFGWDGQGGATLARVAVGFGLSRERVSQVRARLLDRFRTMSANTPSLEAGIRFIAARLPAWAQDLEAGLLTAGLCRRPFRLEGLISAARERRIPGDFVIVEEHGLRLVVAPDFESEARVLLLRTRRGVPSPLHELLPKAPRAAGSGSPNVDNVASSAGPEAPSPVSATEAPTATASAAAGGAVASELARWMLRRARERALFPGRSCWSLIELGWQSEDLAGLQEWGQTGHKTPRELKRVRVLEGTALAGRDELALLFLAYAMDVGRQQAHEGELWPFVRRALSRELQEWFFSDAQLRPWIRDALEAVCSQLSLRHVFGQDGIQAWIRTVFLQFGLSEAGWERLPWWLSGHRATVTLEDLLNPHDQLHSRSFEQLWKALQRGRFGHRDERRLRRELEDLASPWLMVGDPARVAAAAIARPEVVRVDGERQEGALPEASPSLLSEPELRWHAGQPPRFEVALVAGHSGLSPGEYILVIPGHARLAVSLDTEGAWQAGSDSLLLEPRETTISFELLRDDATVVKDLVTLCDEDDELCLFDVTTGRRLDPWGRSALAGRRLALLSRSDLQVSPEPREWCSIFGGAWKLWRLDSGLQRGLKVSLGRETLWTPVALDTPTPVQRGRASALNLGRWGETVRVRVEMQGGLEPVALRLGKHSYDIKHIDGKNVADVWLEPTVTPTARARAVTLSEGRRSTVPVQLVLRQPWGIARQRPGGRWQPVGSEDVLDPAELSASRLAISAPSTWGLAPSELAVLEGHVFQARPRTAERGLASSLHGLGASLTLCRGPYNRADETVTLVAAVIANGLIADIHQEEGVHHLRLRLALEATDEHSIWVWPHGQDAPRPVAADRIRRNADEWCVASEPAAPLAFAVAYRGAWLGARYADSRTGPADMAASIAATPDWHAFALWLRWWRAPILSEPLLSAVEARAIREPVPTLSAWLGNPSGLPAGLRLPQEDPGWPTVVQHLFWNWRPSALQAMSLIDGLGMLSGDPATDWKKGWIGFEDLLTVHPVLLALIARDGVPLLYSEASREETATLLYGLRDLVAGRDDDSGTDEWRVTRARLLEAAAKSMQVDSAFIDPGLLREAKELVEGRRPARDNLRVALVVGPLRRFVAACLLHEFARERA